MNWFKVMSRTKKVFGSYNIDFNTSFSITNQIKTKEERNAYFLLWTPHLLFLLCLTLMYYQKMRSNLLKKFFDQFLLLKKRWDEILNILIRDLFESWTLRQFKEWFKNFLLNIHCLQYSIKKFDNEKISKNYSSSSSLSLRRALMSTIFGESNIIKLAFN
jgi:hypothetical protein